MPGMRQIAYVMWCRMTHAHNQLTGKICHCSLRRHCCIPLTIYAWCLPAVASTRSRDAARPKHPNAPLMQLADSAESPNQREHTLPRPCSRMACWKMVSLSPDSIILSTCSSDGFSPLTVYTRRSTSSLGKHGPLRHRQAEHTADRGACL